MVSEVLHIVVCRDATSKGAVAECLEFACAARGPPELVVSKLRESILSHMTERALRGRSPYQPSDCAHWQLICPGDSPDEIYTESSVQTELRVYNRYYVTLG